jgi:D-alanine transaminase
MSYILYNGKMMPKSQCFLDLDDRGYQFGDGIYEVIRVYDGRLFTCDEHLVRLYRSANEIQLTMPHSQEELKTLLIDLISLNQLTTGYIYLQVTRGVSERNHSFPPSHVQPTLVAYTKEKDRPVDKIENGVSTISVEDIRWLRCDIKSLNLLGNVLAKQKAEEAGSFEAIQIRNGIVTEGSSSNFYIIKDNTVYSHPVSNLILNGITRQVVVDICKENGIKFIEKEYSLEDVYQADETFLTSTTSEIMPVTSVDGKLIADGSVGTLTKRLTALFLEEIKRA